ncbi:hypothetical protein [Streptomyces sp. NPDC049555]|uniref:hypothetical protein n=1 Tax=Streptomyces sp. NPDC049555 TaxID=3154930 RepID=UPI00343D2809
MEGTGGVLRGVRAGVFTALCLTLSVTSHVLLSRLPLPLTTVTVVAAAYFAVAWALAGRERGYGAIAALLVPLELAADTVLTSGQHTCYGPAGGPVTGPLHSMGVDLVCRGGEVGTPAPAGAALPGTTAPWLLLAAHLAAGLIAAAWLRRGEAALAGLLRALAAPALRLLLPAAALAVRRDPGAAHPRPVRDTLPARALPLLVHSVVRRGPPVRPAFA